MTYYQFAGEIKNYWGNYAREGIWRKVEQYLKDRVPECYLDLLLGRLMLNVTTKKFGKDHAPDIADIHQAMRELKEEGKLSRRNRDVKKIGPQITEEERITEEEWKKVGEMMRGLAENLKWKKPC